MNFENREGFIRMDGRIGPWADARVHVLSHTFLCGTDVFEGVRAYAEHGDWRTAVHG